MSEGARLNRLLGLPLAVAVLLALLLSASPAGAKEHGRLSPLLSQLSRPEVAVKPAARQAALLGVPSSGPGSLLREGDRIIVRMRFQQGVIASRAAIRGSGARLIDLGRARQAATVAALPGGLDSLARLPGVASVTPIRAPLLFANCQGGSAISEGVAQLHAGTARTEFGVDGSGITVGVLSDSYDQADESGSGGPIATHASEDVTSADLSGVTNTCLGQNLPVNALDDPPSAEASDEGRAMLQIAHDIAPLASLSFATAFTGEEAFAQNIEELALAGADVLVDDIVYFEEPFFQDGPAAVAVQKVTASGVTYLSAAGNNNIIGAEENEISSWEAPDYRDSGSCPQQVAALPAFNASHCMDFDPGSASDKTFGIRVPAGGTLSLDLQWAEPWGGVATDLDAFLLDAEGRLLPRPAAEDNGQIQLPFELLQWTNETGAPQTVQLVINRFSGPGARLKFVFVGNGEGISGVEYPRSGGGDVVGPSIFGHAGAAAAVAVGAVPFFNGGEAEEYSSRGPVTHYFEPVKSAVPADPLPVPEVISKPDVAATDCGRTTFFSFLSGSTWRFCGTSAAAPHAAGVVALMRQAAPLADGERLRASLRGTASSVGPYGPCAVGGGLVEAVAAVEAAREEIEPVEPGTCSTPDASGAVFVAPGDWGAEAPPPPPPPPVTPDDGNGTPPPVTPEPPTPRAPQTRFLAHPPKLLRTTAARARVVFRFAADQGSVTFLCKLDRTAFRACGTRFVRRLPLGSHVLRVKARGSGGQVDPTPAVFRFRIERR